MLFYRNYNSEQKLEMCQEQTLHSKELSQCKNNGLKSKRQKRLNTKVSIVEWKWQMFFVY